MNDDGETMPLGKAQRIAAGRDAPLPDRPTILIDQGALPRVIDETEQALIASDQGLYQRSGTIVSPRIEQVPAAGGGKTWSFRLPIVAAAHVRECMMRAANFKRYDGRATDYVPCNLPKDVAETYLARAGGWRLPQLVGVITAPLMRADGSILDKPGYDAATALLFEPCGAHFPTVPAHATREDALKALQLFKELLRSFPFTGRADFSVAMSGILTALVRRALPMAPLHGISAPEAGSGKSFLINVISMIAIGQTAPVLPEARSPEETDKSLVAALIAGDAIISLDNCTFPIGGGVLCTALTEPMIKLRVMGLGLNIEIPNSAMLFATANNMVLGTDMPRRTLVGSIDPELERPELRRFDTDPVAIVREDRGKYVVAGLTILRAFHNAGRPQIAAPVASFGEWSKLIRNALLWLGEEDPCSTMEKAREADGALKELANIIDHWERVPTLLERRKTASELIAIASEEDRASDGSIVYRYREFRDALMAVASKDGGGMNARRLGKWLLKSEKRISRGRRIVRDGAHAGITFWKLELVESSL
jgi:putative DNA primase/helicase